MVKRLHSGHAAHSGVMATVLAAEGFTGTEDVLEAEFGGFCSTMGGGSVDLERLTEGLGDQWETLEVAFKPYPSCAAAQASIEAVRILRSRQDLEPATIERITITTSEHVRVHSGWAYEPQGVTAAQMSIGYGVAQMLSSGSLSAEHFTPERISDPAIVDLARRVEVRGDPAIDALGPDRRYVADVVIHTGDGGTLGHHIEDRPGNTSNPLTDEQLHNKFTGLAAPVIGTDRTDALRAAIASLERLERISPIAELLTPPALPDEVTG
jgi:2-methylcitrate dehydratase PrpD